MERSIRLGKDFNVLWSINKVVDGERQPYELAGKELVLQYRRPNGTLHEAKEWRVDGNIIIWTFRGRDQKAPGSYQLILTENGGKDGMVTVDTCRSFKLVEHSCEETEGSGSDIVIEDVVLESEVAFAALRGPQGERGPEGPQGPQGERGPQGEQGPAGPSYNDTEIQNKLAELSAKLTEVAVGEKSVTLVAGPTYTMAYFDSPLPVGTKIKSISFNGVASWFYWANGQGSLFTDAQISASSAPMTLSKEVYGVATPGDTSTEVTIVYEAEIPSDKLSRIDEDIEALEKEVDSITNAITETKENLQTIEVDTPAAYYGQKLFDTPIPKGTEIKSIEVSGAASWFYWANGQGSLFTDAQISASSAPMVLDRDVYGVAAPSSTSVHIKIVASYGTQTIDKVARIDEDVQNLKNGKKWEGKTIVAFGDSITHFIGSDNKTYSDHLAEITGANVINCGIGGSTYRQRATPQDSTTDENVARAALDIVNMVKAAITQNFTAQENAAALITTHQPYTLDYEMQVNNLVGVDWSKVDAVIFFGGTNDYANVGQLLGEDNSTNLGETKGALNYILTEFCKTYPHIKINFLTPIVRYVDPPQFSTSKQYNVGDVTMYQGGRYKFINAHSGAWDAADVQSITSYEARVDATWGDNYKNAGDMTLREYGEALGEFVKKVYHIIPIDMYNIGWNRVNFDNYFVNTDATHPLTGFKALAEVMAKKLDL